MNSKTLLVSALSVVLSAAAVNAASIGINFTAIDNTLPNSLASTSLAGVTAVAQTNWNNVLMGNTDGNGHWNGVAVNGTLTDSTGAVQTGLNMAAGGDSYMNNLLGGSRASVQCYPFDGANVSGAQDWGFTGNTAVIEDGGWYHSGYLDLTNIPYASYSLYVYIAPNGGNGGYSGTVGLAVMGGGGTVDPNQTTDGAFTFGWNSGALTQGSNYVVMPNNTSPSIEISLPGTTSWNGGMAAVQIVNTAPEPASLALLALGGLLVLPRRKSVR